MIKKKICILAHFGFGQTLLNGQTIKTKIITEELENQLGKNEVLKIDTHGGIKNLLKAPFQVLKALRQSKNVIILPAHNGVRVYVPLLTFFRKFFKKRKLHYIVIGGWLASFLKNKKGLARKLKKFDGIYVETKTMKADLENMGFQNIVILPNCKKLNILSESELIYSNGEPYKLCTFSRVMKEKGIEDAVNAVKAVNEKFGRVVYTLDIYGQVDENQVEWFDCLQKEFPDYVKYCGVVAFDKSVEVLKHYFALLFPTRYWTEGLPGTIIDAYAAGIPVIASKWENYSNIIDENTGIGYTFCSVEDFLHQLINIAQNPQIIFEKKVNCLNKAYHFSSDTVGKKIINKINESIEVK